MKYQPIMVAIAVAICLMICETTNAATITLKSGNAGVGQRDPEVYFTDGFSQIQEAWVIPQAHPYWGEAIAGTQWVAPTQDGYGVVDMSLYTYYTNFDMPSTFRNPRITVTYRSDDAGRYLTLNDTQWGGWAGFWPSDIRTYSTDDPTLFHSGSNKLGFIISNESSPSGLDFFAEVSYDPVPEPSSIIALLCGIGGLGGMIRLKRP